MPRRIRALEQVENTQNQHTHKQGPDLVGALATRGTSDAIPADITAVLCGRDRALYQTAVDAKMQTADADSRCLSPSRVVSPHQQRTTHLARKLRRVSIGS